MHKLILLSEGLANRAEGHWCNKGDLESNSCLSGKGEEGVTGLSEVVVLLSGCVNRDQKLAINFEWPWDSIPNWKGS